jgi:hypothetical protein
MTQFLLVMDGYVEYGVRNNDLIGLSQSFFPIHAIPPFSMNLP